MRELVLETEITLEGVPGHLEVHTWDNREEDGQKIDTYRGTFYFYIEDEGGINPFTRDCLRYLPPGSEFSLQAFLDAPCIYDFDILQRQPQAITRHLSEDELLKGLGQTVSQHPERLFYSSWDDFKQLKPTLEFWRKQAQPLIYSPEQHKKVGAIAGEWWALGDEHRSTSGDALIDLFLKSLESDEGGNEQLAKQNITEFIVQEFQKAEKFTTITLSTDYSAEAPLKNLIKGLSIKVPLKTVMWITPLCVQVRNGYGSTSEYLYRKSIVFI